MDNCKDTPTIALALAKTVNVSVEEASCLEFPKLALVERFLAAVAAWEAGVLLPDSEAGDIPRSGL